LPTLLVDPTANSGVEVIVLQRRKNAREILFCFTVFYGLMRQKQVFFFLACVTHHECSQYNKRSFHTQGNSHSFVCDFVAIHSIQQCSVFTSLSKA